jgi:hypothetical protein
MLNCDALSAAADARLVAGEVLTNWGISDLDAVRTGCFLPPEVSHPQNQYDVAASVKAAESSGKIVRALGSLYSFSDAAIPQTEPCQSQSSLPYGFAINTSGLNRNLQNLLPKIRRTLFEPGLFFFVEAGITIDDLNHLLDKYHLALPTMGGSSGQTLAGAISTGTHGSDFDRPPLADCVRAIYLIGAGGVHHWIEPSAPMTDPEKLRSVFPCLSSGQIHYDDTTFYATLVSMGAMGIIYAVIIEVEMLYLLAQVTRYGTWEALLTPSAGGGSADLSGAMSGLWTGMTGLLRARYSGITTNNRALQVAINPVANDDGTHTCYVTNRALVTWQATASGPTPVDLSQIDVSTLAGKIFDDPDCGPVETGVVGGVLLGLMLEASQGPPPVETMYKLRQLIGSLECFGYNFAVRAMINYVLASALPEYDPHDLSKKERIDTGFNIMAYGVFKGGFPSLSFVSMEAFFDLPTGIAYINQLLNQLNTEVKAHHYPVGYVSLRTCGKTRALLGMERFSPTAAVEFTLIATDNCVKMVKDAEDLAIGMGGFLHWGQSNGRLDGGKLGQLFDTATIQRWKSVQQRLAGLTFTNQFMKRLGLDSPSIDPIVLAPGHLVASGSIQSL